MPITKLLYALHQLGIIDPVLTMNWAEERSNQSDYTSRLAHAVQVANSYQADFTLLLTELEKLDSKTLSFLAMEVAREYADFHARNHLQ